MNPTNPRKTASRLPVRSLVCTSVAAALAIAAAPAQAISFS